MVTGVRLLVFCWVGGGASKLHSHNPHPRWNNDESGPSAVMESRMKLLFPQNHSGSFIKSLFGLEVDRKKVRCYCSVLLI